jgi:putative ABC transport system substrate-binding protein
LPVIDAAAPILGLKVVQAHYRSAAELERVIDEFAAQPNGALVVVPPPPRGRNRALIEQLALKHRLPTIGSNRHDVMMAYGSNPVERFRIAASYTNRILRGAKVSDLPVQFPTKFELVVNLKTAKAIGLTIPEAFLLRADKVIE